MAAVTPGTTTHLLQVLVLCTALIHRLVIDGELSLGWPLCREEWSPQIRRVQGQKE